MKSVFIILVLLAPAAAQQHKNTITVTCSGVCQTQPDGVTAINIYRTATSGSGYLKIGSVPVVPVTGTPIVVTYNDSNVVPGNTFFYVATVSNPGGESSYSVQSPPCTTPFQTPATPPSLSVVSQ